MMVSRRFYIVIFFAISLTLYSSTYYCYNPEREPYSLIIKGHCPKLIEVHCDRKNARHSKIEYKGFMIRLYFPDLTKKTDENSNIPNIQLIRKKDSKTLVVFHSPGFSLVDIEGYYVTDLDKNGVPEIVFGGNSLGSVGGAASWEYIFVVSLSENNSRICKISSDYVFSGYNFRDVDGDGYYEFICLRSDQSIDQYGEYEQLYYRTFKYKKGKFLLEQKSQSSLRIFQRKTDSDVWKWKCVKQLSKSQRQRYDSFTTPTVSW